MDPGKGKDYQLGSVGGQDWVMVSSYYNFSDVKLASVYITLTFGSDFNLVLWRFY